MPKLLVRDAADNPVKGALVSFSAVADPSNGRIEPATATTDSSGVASVAFFPGPNSTGNNQIRMQAAIPSAGIAAITTLTASKQELVVRIGTGNLIETPDSTKYAMPWTAVVTDANGNPVVGATIQVSVVGVRFFKGRYFWNGVVWVPRGETSTRLDGALVVDRHSGLVLRLDLRSAQPLFQLQRRLVRVESAGY